MRPFAKLFQVPLIFFIAYFIIHTPAYAGKNIVICSDGTGQASNDPNSSNVFQLCSLLDLTDPRKQVAGYDAGVGTVTERKMVEEMKKEKEKKEKEARGGEKKGTDLFSVKTPAY